MNSYELDQNYIKNLVDLIISKKDIIDSLDPEIFFNGSEDGGLKDGITGLEARGIKFYTSNTDDYFAEKYLKDESKKKYCLAFDEIIQQVSSLDKISHAFLFWIYPNNIIPSHKDDEDPTYRLIISLNEPGENYSLSIENYGQYRLSKYESIGFMAQRIEHSGYNYTENSWMILTLCFNYNDEK